MHRHAPFNLFNRAISAVHIPSLLFLFLHLDYLYCTFEQNTCFPFSEGHFSKCTRKCTPLCHYLINSSDSNERREKCLSVSHTQAVFFDTSQHELLVSHHLFLYLPQASCLLLQCSFGAPKPRRLQPQWSVQICEVNHQASQLQQFNKWQWYRSAQIEITRHLHWLHQTRVSSSW